MANLPAPDPDDVGLVVRAIIDETGLTATELAILAEVTTFTAQRIIHNRSVREDGRVMLRIDTAQRIADALYVEVKELFHSDSLNTTGRPSGSEVHVRFTIPNRVKLEQQPVYCQRCGLQYPQSRICDICGTELDL